MPSPFFSVRPFAVLITGWMKLQSGAATRACPISPMLDIPEIFISLNGASTCRSRRHALLVNEPGRYYLPTQEVRARDGHRTTFGGVEIKKHYVSAHLMPIYAYPDLLADISPDLRNRQQGKSSFNFKRLPPLLA